MQKSPLYPFGASSDDTITLMNGQTIPLIYVSFIPLTYQFVYNKAGTKIDVTNQMTQAQKRLFPEFDVVESNYRIYNQKRFGVNTGAKLETSVSKLFVENVAADLDKKTNLGISSFSSTLALVVGGFIIYKLLQNSSKS